MTMLEAAVVAQSEQNFSSILTWQDEALHPQRTIVVVQASLQWNMSAGVVSEMGPAELIQKTCEKTGILMTTVADDGDCAILVNSKAASGEHNQPKC